MTDSQIPFAEKPESWRPITAVRALHLVQFAIDQLENSGKAHAVEALDVVEYSPRTGKKFIRRRVRVWTEPGHITERL